MTEIKKEGRYWRKKVALIICAILVVILAISNIGFFMRTINLQSQVSSLEADKSSLESQVSNLQSQIDSLQNEVNTLKHYSYTLVDNDTLIYQLDTSKTYGPFSVSHAGIMLVRVETPFLGYAGTILAEIQVLVSGEQPYISRKGNLLLVRTHSVDRIKTAIFPIASHVYPLNELYVTIIYPREGDSITNTEPIQLSVTITYVEG